MVTEYFANGSAPIGGKEIPFEKRLVLNRFYLYVPHSFQEDRGIISNYCYMYSVDKSPLGIALKYTQGLSALKRQKLAVNFLAKEAAKGVDTAGENVLYGESQTLGVFADIYSLRFIINMENGVVTGCFNCEAAYASHWKEAVLQALQGVEEV